MIPKTTKLNIRFHNPNTPEATADYITSILVAANQKKIDDILKGRASEGGNNRMREGSRYLA